MIINFTNDDIRYMKSVIYEAGMIADTIQKDSIHIERKVDKSIVTQADLLVQNYIIEKFSEKFKGLNFIHEENFDRAKREVNDDIISIIIDPIDGTSMFSMYLPIWCVSVGVFMGYEPMYGFVFSPGSNMFFYNDNEFSYLNDRILYVEKIAAIDSETNIFYSTEVYKNIQIDFSGKVRNMGSTAFHAVLMADNKRNRLLAFIGKSYLWDWAGAIPIILKAGVKIKYLNGSKINYKEIIENNYEIKDYLIAYNVDDFNLIQKIFTIIN